MNYISLLVVQSQLDTESFGKALAYVKSLPSECRTYLPEAKSWVIATGAPGSDSLVKHRADLEAAGWKIRLFMPWPEGESFKQKRGQKLLAYAVAFNRSLRTRRDSGQKSHQGF